jgi:uncharacterized protein (DUF305 family)
VNFARRAAIVTGGLTLTLALAACAGDDTTTTTPSGETAGTTSTAPGSAMPSASSSVTDAHNAADVEFAQQMIVHHRGALEMAEMAVERAQNEQVVALADRIVAAQGPEIDTMTSWLEAWGEPVPEGDSMDGMGHEGMDMGSMPGMMTEEQMAELMSAEGTAVDQMFLQMMTEHHRGAVEMARTEQAEGENPDAVALAEQIEASQLQEIEEMQQLLQNL